MKKKRILIHSLVFNPDGVSTAYLYGDIARALKENGFEVTVLTTTPHYNKVPEQMKGQPLKWKVWGLIKQSDFEGIKVYHIPQKKFQSTLLRLFGFAYWHIVSFVTAICMGKRDIILSPSPPLTIGLLNVWIGKLKGSKVVYNVQEVYPDILGKKSGPVYSILSRMERYIYSRSAAVTTIDRIFHDTIVDRFKNPGTLHIIPNFVDTELYRPLEDRSSPDTSLFIENDHLKLVYAGNIGMAQDWETLLELASLTADRKIDYYVIGEGMMKHWLEEQVRERNLRNIRILPYQPREMMPRIIAFSDIQYIFMEPEIAAQGFPSKVYTIMASEKPMLICSPENTPLVDFLAGLGCAKIITKAEPRAKAEEIALWLNTVSPDELKRMGLAGRTEIEERYSKEVVTQQYCKLLQSI